MFPNYIAILLTGPNTAHLNQISSKEFHLFQTLKYFIRYLISEFLGSFDHDCRSCFSLLLPLEIKVAIFSQTLVPTHHITLHH